MKTRLSVNINKVALIRNSRGGDLPNLIQFAKDCEKYGADGITVHPRPDERHVRYADLYPLKEIVTTEFNIEGYPSKIFLKKVEKIQPDQCTLVPDAPNVLTSNEGWKIETNKSFLIETIKRLKAAGIRVSLFLDPNERSVMDARDVGADRIEFYTGKFAHGYIHNQEMAVADHVKAAKLAKSLDLGVNAGHDLNLDNLRYYRSMVPSLKEVSIGHALISDALYYGISNAIGMYQALLLYERNE